MKAEIVHLFLTLALVAQGPISDLDPGPDAVEHPVQLALVVCARSDAPLAGEACVRSDAADDDDSSELDESGASCLPPRSGGSTPRRTSHASPPAAAVPPVTQDGPAPAPSRAPPLP